METFSKLRPPEAVRIKAKLIERLSPLPSSSSSSHEQEPSSPTTHCDHNHNNTHPLDQLLNDACSGETTTATTRGNNGGTVATTITRNKDRRISSASQVSTISTSSSSCTSSSISNGTTSHQHHPTNSSSYRICELKKFCVDPQVTSFDVLSDLIAHAFAIKSEFRLSYLNRAINCNNKNNNNLQMSESVMPASAPEYISLQTDWDLDAAFSSSSQPYLSLNIELLSPSSVTPSFQSPPPPPPFSAEAISEEWEVINSSIPSSSASSSSSSSSSPVPGDTTTSSSASGDHAISPNNLNTAVVHAAQKSLPKSKSTVIHKCVSVFHKVFNNFARSNSFNNTPTVTTTRSPNERSIQEEEHQRHECLTPSLSPRVTSDGGGDGSLSNERAPRSPSLSGAGTAPPPVSPQMPTTPNTSTTTTTTYSERSTAATVAAAAAALLTGASQYYHKSPLGDAEFRNFCDSDGRIVNLVDLKQRIFEGGCEPGKRRELWPILLDIYPDVCATHAQRDEFLRLKQTEYTALKYSLWMHDHRDLMIRSSSAHCISDSSFDSNNAANNAQHHMNNVSTGAATARHSTVGLPPHHTTAAAANSFDINALYSLAHKIHKDVCRTDRNQKFYAGDCNPHVASLFNILITYSLSHPHMPYAQGMSDLLSPLLYVLRDESLAFTCFAALLNRCAPNFCVHSDSIALKIKLLGSLLARYDPELWSHLAHVGADQMLFVYRWLLLECKREFPFEDSLRVLECMWSTIDSSSTSSNNNTNTTTANNVDMAMSKNFLTRSNSTVSSTFSLRLFKDICRTGGGGGGVGGAGLRAISNDCDYFAGGGGGCGGGGSEEQDDDFVGSENMLAMDESVSISAGIGKSRHQSHNSQASSTNTNNMRMNHKETCDMCMRSSSSPQTTATANEKKSLMTIKRTSSTIDGLSDLSTSTRSRSSSSSRSNSSSSLTSSSSIISDDDNDNDVDDDEDDDNDDDESGDDDVEDENSSDVCNGDELDCDEVLETNEEGSLKHSQVSTTSKVAAAAKSTKPMGVRLRRFSLNLSFLKSASSKKSKGSKATAKLNEINNATPPTSASLTNELECSNLINQQKRFQLNKRFFNIIKKKKETTDNKLESNMKSMFFCSSPSSSSSAFQEAHDKSVTSSSLKKCERNSRRRSRHLSSQQFTTSQHSSRNVMRSKSLSYLDNANSDKELSLSSSSSWMRSRAKSSGPPASISLAASATRTTTTKSRQMAAKGEAIPCVRVSASPQDLLLLKTTTKKFSLPVYMKTPPNLAAVNAATANQIAMSSSTKFSTSEAETIVMASNNHQSANNLRSSFCQQLSHSPTIVNTAGSQKLGQIYHRSTPKGKKASGVAKGDENKAKRKVTGEPSNKPPHRRHGNHKKSRTRARQYCPTTTTTTTTGEEENERATIKRSSGRRKKNRHHHNHRHRHEKKTSAGMSTSPSFKHIKNSLKRSQRYLNSFYATTKATTATTRTETTTKQIETESNKPLTATNLDKNTNERISSTTMGTSTVASSCTCANRRASINGCVQKAEMCVNIANGGTNTANTTCNRSQTSKCGNNTHSSSKSSTSAYVSAAHSLASSHSSLCSTNFNQISNQSNALSGYSAQQQQQQQQIAAQIKVTGGTTTTATTSTSSRRSSFVSKQIPIINITSPVSGSTRTAAVPTTTTAATTTTNNTDDHENEEELIYQLSKLDNPFLLFMCLSMFIEHRKHIMRSQMDANDIACYFDKMARKHCVRPILARARYLYTKLYLAKANVFSYIQQLMDIQNSP